MHDDLRGLVGARGATRQAMAQYVNRLLNTRIAAFHLIRQTHGKWGASRYILQADEGALSGRGSLAATTRSAMIEKA
jgi:hypothetical protein